MRVQAIFLEKGVLRIEGHDPWTNQMRDMGELSPDDRTVVLLRHRSKDLHA